MTASRRFFEESITQLQPIAVNMALLNRYLPLAFEEFSRYSLDIEELLKCEAASVDDIRTGRWRILSECQQITRH
jgi:hypothetical protein